jgi:phage gp36-like protein
MATPNVYATIADLEALGIAGDALAKISAPIKNQALGAASRLIDGFLAAQFVLPVTYWGQDVRGVCCDIAAWRLLANRGFNPSGQGGDENIRLAYEDAMKLLNLWARDDGARPDVIDSGAGKEQTPTAAPTVSSSPSRGWSQTGMSTTFGPGIGIPFTSGR